MKKQTMRSNFIYNISYELFRIIVPLITTPYISRVLGSNGVGTYTLAHTYSQYFILFAGFGFSTYAARELAYERDDSDKLRNTFWEVFLLRLLFMSLSIILYLILFFTGEFRLNSISNQICIIYLIAALFDFSYYFRAMENFKKIALRNFAIKIFSLVLIFCLINDESQVWLYTLILASSEFLGQLIMIFSLDKSLFRRFKIRKNNLKKHFVGAFALFIPTLAIQVYGMLDKVMLGAMVGEGAVGYYENAQKMVRLASTIPSAMVAVSTPHVAYDYSQGNYDKIKAHFTRVFRYVSFLAFPMCLGLIAIAPNFSNWFYGSKFVGIESLVMAGAVLIISLAWSGLLGNMILVATGNQKYYTISVYIGAALNICMNTALIPRIGAMGAILSSDVAELTGMVLMFYFSNKIFGIGNNLKYAVRYFISASCMGVVIFTLNQFMKYNLVSTIIEIVIGLIVYIAIMIIRRDDCLWEMIKAFTEQINRIKNRKSRDRS